MQPINLRSNSIKKFFFNSYNPLYSIYLLSFLYFGSIVLLNFDISKNKKIIKTLNTTHHISWLIMALLAIGAICYIEISDYTTVISAKLSFLEYVKKVPAAMLKNRQNRRVESSTLPL